MRVHTSYKTALSAAFPTISLNNKLGVLFSTILFTTKFPEKYGSWQRQPLSVVGFFNRLAHERNFHPTQEWDKWYTIKYSDLEIYKVNSVAQIGKSEIVFVGCCTDTIYSQKL